MWTGGEGIEWCTVRAVVCFHWPCWSIKLHPAWDLVLNPEGPRQPCEGTQGTRVWKRCENLAASRRARAVAVRMCGTAAARTHQSTRRADWLRACGWTGA